MRYFITFSCYGARLHGDELGSVERRQNLFGSRTLESDPLRVEAGLRRMEECPYEMDGISRVVVLEAVKEVFGTAIPPISSTKSLSGHSLGAAGVQEAIYSILMLNNGFACESAHIEELDPAFEDLPILRQRADRQLNCVLSNSFGFGGTNATLAFTRVAA